MKLGAYLDRTTLESLQASARTAEELGYESVWTGEAYGDDAVTTLAVAAAATTRINVASAIMQIPARTPSLTAMTAVSLHHLSAGRFILGLGLSGPQVVEGWHGKPYRAPLATTREYVDIVRQIFAAQDKITLDGSEFQLPYAGPDGTGLGKAMRAANRPVDIPIHLAALGPKNVALTAEIADGLLPMLWHPELSLQRYGALLTRPNGERLEISPTVLAAAGDDIARCRDKVRPLLGYYIGGMGAKGKNFYNDTVASYGYGDVAATVQDLYLSGDRAAAVAAVPDQLVDELCLVGDEARMRDRLHVWRGSVDRIIVASSNAKVLAAVAAANT